MEGAITVAVEEEPRCRNGWHFNAHSEWACPECGELWKVLFVDAPRERISAEEEQLRRRWGQVSDDQLKIHADIDARHREAEEVLYAAMRERTRRTAMQRIEQDDPRTHRRLVDFTESMAAHYENSLARFVARPMSMPELMAAVRDAVGTLHVAVIGGGDNASVIASAADVALLSLMAAVRTEEGKRARRVAAGTAYYSQGFGIENFVPEVSHVQEGQGPAVEGQGPEDAPRGEGERPQADSASTPVLRGGGEREVAQEEVDPPLSVFYHARYTDER